MRLIKLSIRQFKGIQSFEFTPDGQSASIYGANASGKTTIADAVSWLLFDKDTQDKSPANFGIKTVDKNGEPLSGEEHTVEAVFELESGERVILRKVYQEKWTKKRGSNNAELTGHTTSYYWDDEPVSQKDYKERIEGIMPEQLFKMLTLPNYFAEQMHWTERRNILTELCGEIDDEEIVSGHPELSGYSKLLDGKTQEARIKILRERRKKLNDEIDNIPSRIDENNQKIAEPETTRDQAENSIRELTEQITMKREEISTLNSGGGVSDLQVKVQQIEADKSKARNEHNQQVEESLKDARRRVADLEDKVDQAEAEMRQATREYNDAKVDVEAAESAASQIAADIESEQQRQPDPKPEEKGPQTCPYCKQDMPQDDDPDHDPDAHYEQYVKDFNMKKAEKLKDLKADLQTAHMAVETLTADLKQREQDGAKARAKLNQRKEALEKAKSDLQAKKEQQPQFDATEFDTQQKDLEAKIDEIRLSKQDSVQKVKDQITALESEVEQRRQVVRQHEFNAQIHARNKELKELLKKYGQELNDVEQALNLIEDFNRAKANFITDKVNGLFEIVSWRLFKEQVNGGMTEVADPVVGGVPFSEGLNNAARIQAGIDIIKTLSKFYGKSAPCFIDNRESCTHIPQSSLQIISLIVSPQDKSLRVETEEKELAVA